MYLQFGPSSDSVSSIQLVRKRSDLHRVTFVGLRYMHRMSEHIVPQFMNKKWQQQYKSYSHTRDVKEFIKLYREKVFLQKRKARK
jgi:hypothetical protein